MRTLLIVATLCLLLAACVLQEQELPAKCALDGQVGCPEFQLSPVGLALVLQNEGPTVELRRFTIQDDASGASCEAIRELDTKLEDGERFEILFEGCRAPTGEPLRARMTLEYTVRESGLVKRSEGTLRAWSR